jgi:DNA-binding protein
LKLKIFCEILPLDFDYLGKMPPDTPLEGKMRLFYRKYLYLPIYLFFEVRNMADLPIAAVVRIAKKNGAERVGSDAAEALVIRAEKYIAQLTKESNKLAEHAGRKTIKKEDVDLAAKQ